MTEALHVLAYGSVEAGVCDTIRSGMFRSALAGNGVELRTWDRYSIAIPPEFEERPEAALAAGVAELDRSALDWADVVVFRRWYQTGPACAGCDTVAPGHDAIGAHVRLTGHLAARPDLLVRPLVATILQRPEFLRGRALVYDLDDDLLAPGADHGLTRRMAVETDLVETLLRRADLVTVASPVLATMAGRYNAAVRLVRNAVDPAWYGRAEEPLDERPAGDPRLGYYGVPVRLRDYALARDAVEALVVARPGTRRVWLGAAHDPAVRAAMDEVHPYVEGVPAFAAALARLRLDIGLAPVRDEPFNRAKSELHWLEYSLAGAATIASRTPAGPGPYDVIRDGLDGLLATTSADWARHLAELAASPDRRAELVGRARERIAAEYTIETRAAEWAAAYRWAADHAGRGAVAV